MFFVPSKKINQNNLQPYNQRYLKMETILVDKLNLKNPSKTIALRNLSILHMEKHEISIQQQ